MSASFWPALRYQNRSAETTDKFGSRFPLGAVLYSRLTLTNHESLIVNSDVSKYHVLTRLHNGRSSYLPPLRLMLVLAVDRRLVFS